MRPRRSIERAAWKPSTARRVTQMRSFGTTLSTSVQADMQGPSITTRSPEAATLSNMSRNGPTCPPGLSRMRTSARANIVTQAHSTTASSRVKMIRVMVMTASPVPPLAAQGRQPDAGRIEAAIDGQDLSGDVARAIAAEEEDGLRQFLFEPVPVERDRIVIVGPDLGGMHRLRHRGLDRPGR